MVQLQKFSELLQSTSLDDAMAEVENAVWQNPSALNHRMALFQILIMNGAWERALKQLYTCYRLSDSLSKIAETYGDLIRAERQREQVFSGKRAPAFLGEKPIWAEVLTQAIGYQEQKNYDLADTLRLQAFAQISDVVCTVETTSNVFEVSWITDVDSRIGPTIEIMYCGRYFWVPIEQIQELRFYPIEDLRDLVWRAIEIRLKNGEELMQGFMPARYPYSYLFGEDEKLSKKTSWQMQGQTGNCGFGQKMWMSEDCDFSVNECNALIFK